MSNVLGGPGAPSHSRENLWITGNSLPSSAIHEAVSSDISPLRRTRVKIPRATKNQLDHHVPEKGPWDSSLHQSIESLASFESFRHSARNLLHSSPCQAAGDKFEPSASFCHDLKHLKLSEPPGVIRVTFSQVFLLLGRLGSSKGRWKSHKNQENGDPQAVESTMLRYRRYFLCIFTLPLRHTGLSCEPT